MICTFIKARLDVTFVRVRGEGKLSYISEEINLPRYSQRRSTALCTKVILLTEKHIVTARLRNNGRVKISRNVR